MASLIQRDGIYYLQYCIGGRARRRSLHTDNFQLAKEKIRQIESGFARGGDLALPTRTPVADVLTQYAQHIRTIKTAKSAQTDIYYLRQVLGLVWRGSKRKTPWAAESRYDLWELYIQYDVMYDRPAWNRCHRPLGPPRAVRWTEQHTDSGQTREETCA